MNQRKLSSTNLLYQLKAKTFTVNVEKYTKLVDLIVGRQHFNVHIEYELVQ